MKQDIRGTGLGLYIAKKMIEAPACADLRFADGFGKARASAGKHGGTISAESPGEGKGSMFFVKLRKV